MQIMPYVSVEVAGGCPRCGNPAIVVPDDCTPETIIKCSHCALEAQHEDFFDRRLGDD